MHVIADGKRIEPAQLSSTRLAFMLPAGCSTIELCSRTFVPAHVVPESGDLRALGICVARIQLDGVELPLDAEEAFTEGWHHLETYADHQQRWSTGQTSLPAGTRLVVLDVAACNPNRAGSQSARFPAPINCN